MGSLPPDSMNTPVGHSFDANQSTKQKRDSAIKEYPFSMVTKRKSPKGLISYIKMKMTQIIDVSKQDEKSKNFL